MLLLLGQDGPLRGGKAAGRQTRGNFPAARLRPGRLPVLGVVPQVRTVAACAHRAMEPQVQLRLARSLGVHGVDSDGTGGALQRPDIRDVLRTDADFAAAPELRVQFAAVVPRVDRQSHDIRRHQRAVLAGDHESVLEGISLQAEDPRPTIPRRRQQLVVVLVSGEKLRKLPRKFPGIQLLLPFFR